MREEYSPNLLSISKACHLFSWKITHREVQRSEMQTCKCVPRTSSTCIEKAVHENCIVTHKVVYKKLLPPASQTRSDRLLDLLHAVSQLRSVEL